MTWDNIIVHCSDSLWGSAAEIRRWHLSNGWKDIGYHFVVLNGRIQPDFTLPLLDGMIEVGRPLDGDSKVEEYEKGAHAFGYNNNSIGVCLIGKENFSRVQFNNLMILLESLQRHFNISVDNIKGHYEVSKKSCPNFNVQRLLSMYGISRGLKLATK